jgi:glycosyltransferase involved in cell wall biosynthesis
MRILFVTDAWEPQVNGVVRTMQSLIAALEHFGIQTTLLSPQGFRSLAMPTYGDIRLAVTRPRTIARAIESARADHIHIVTEGPLGILARRECLRQGRKFSTSYHTRFPEYLRARMPIPQALSYALLRRFHNAGIATLAATPSLVAELQERGFTRIAPWGRGVDLERFNPGKRADLGLPGPIFLYVGRVAVEKNIPAFLDLDLPGTKLVVGGGPDLDLLKSRYPQVRFAGPQFGEELARTYASCDVFVFPSRTDTFGLVILEALASGLPVAAFPVTGPVDILAEGGGIIDTDLGRACLAALDIPRDAPRRHAERFRWENCAEMFLRAIGA